jgi:diacylglycerol O-acyltransferase / wax synthase
MGVEAKLMSTLLQIDSEDASFLFSEKLDNPAHLSVICLYDQDPLKGDVVRFQNLRQLIANRLQTSPVLKQRLRRVPADLDYPYWVDDEGFDIDYHLRHLALPQPGDWRQFCIQVARLHSRSLDTRRPLWELYVIEGLNALPGLPEGSFALYFKVHHCAMDQFTAMEFLNSMHEHQSNPSQHEETLPRVRHIPIRAPSNTEVLINGAIGNGLRLASLALPPWRQYRRLGAYLRVRSLHDTSLRADSPQGQNRGVHFGLSKSSARVFDGISVPLSLLEQLSDAVPDSNLNHSLTLICGEATRRYLQQQRLGNTLQINARIYLPTGTAGAHVLAGNAHAHSEVDTYCGIENMLERLTAISSTVSDHDKMELENRSRALRSRYEGLPALFNHFLSQQAGHQHGAGEDAESVAIHLIEGADDTLYLLGAKLATITGLGPLADGCSLVYSATLYDGKVHLSFTSDREKLPEPLLLKAELKQVIEDLQRTA